MDQTRISIGNDLEALQALEWLVDCGVDECLDDVAVDRFALYEQQMSEALSGTPMVGNTSLSAPDLSNTAGAAQRSQSVPVVQAAAAPLTAAPSLEGVYKICNEAKDLDSLKAALQEFPAFDFQTMAENIVFSSGHPRAEIMIVGDIPRDEDDASGVAFDPSGDVGGLLDKILTSIHLDRDQVYLTHLMPWRPPGNRSLTASEIATALPILERHIALVRPKYLWMLGGVVAQNLLGQKAGISKLRREIYQYKTQSAGLHEKLSDVQAFALYHPSYLLQTPLQKRLMWQDLLRFDAIRSEKTGQKP